MIETLKELVDRLKASDPDLRRDRKALRRAINREEVVGEGIPSTETRKGSGKEKRFIKILLRNGADLLAIKRLDTEEEREDAVEKVFTDKIAAEEVKPAQGIKAESLEDQVAALWDIVTGQQKQIDALTDVLKSNALRRQYERRGVSVSDPHFGEDERPVILPNVKKWTDLARDGEPVKASDLKEFEPKKKRSERA